jgi:hypothetical protein
VGVVVAGVLATQGKKEPQPPVAPAATAPAPPPPLPATSPAVTPAEPPPAQASAPVAPPGAPAAEPRPEAPLPAAARPVQAAPPRPTVRPLVKGGKAQAQDLLKRGDGLRASGDVDGAVKAYLAAEVADPSLAALQKKLAVCYQQMGDTQSARERYQRYLATDPADAAKVRLILETLQ